MIIKAEDYKPEEKIFALHVGESGDGKSAAAASYPRPFHQVDYDNRFDGVVGALKPQGFLPESTASAPVTGERFYIKNGYEPFQKWMDDQEMLRIVNQFYYKTVELASIGSFMQALIASSHKLQSGMMIGKLRVSGPGDFNFEVTGMRQCLDQLMMLPCHVICSVHVIPKFGKGKIKDKNGNLVKDTYGPNEIVGEKLNVRDQPGAAILGMFSNVFRFSREVDGDNMKYYVEFASELAKNAFGIPPGLFDITNKPFYPFLQELIQKLRSGQSVKPAADTSLFTKLGV